MTIAEVLADTLEGRGVTQQDAADVIGVRQSAVSRWVAGKDAPKDEHVPALMKFTGLSRGKVLEAIHLQRTTQVGMPSRVRALEVEVAAMRDQLAEALELLRGRAPRAR